MPTYEYECDDCGRRFELQQGMTEAPARKCPHCGGRVRRLVSGGSGFIMKGGHDASACSFESQGHTCCGRDERCGEPRCDDGAG